MGSVSKMADKMALKIFFPNIGFMVFKLTGSDSWFQRKNAVKKYTPSPKILQKNVQNQPSKPNHQNLTHFGPN